MNLLDDFTASPQEAIIAILIGAFFATLIFAYADVVLHVNYIKPLHFCHPDTNEVCDKIRDINDCLPDEDPNCIGQRYWSVLPSIFLILAIVVGSLRVIIGKMAGHEFNGMLILIGLLWFFTILVLPYTGWADYFYYVIIDEPVPPELPWLNDFYLITLIDIGGDPENVEREDLYFLMGVGLVSLILAWGIVTHLHRKDVLEFLK